MRKNIIFLDGATISASTALRRSLSPGILCGRGVFETMRAYRGRIFALEQHTARLFRGLRALGIAAPHTRRQFHSHLFACLELNKLKNARLRLTVWREHRCVRTAVIAAAYQPPARMLYTHGCKAALSSIRHAKRTTPPYVKSIRYLPLLTAFRTAQSRGYHEALIRNRQGLLVEGSRSNIFCARDGAMYTPALLCGCLDGITRRLVITLARTYGIACREAKIPSQEIYSYDEVFLTNSLIEILPVSSVAGKRIGSGRVGTVTAALLKHYKKMVRAACAA